MGEILEISFSTLIFIDEETEAHSGNRDDT